MRIIIVGCGRNGALLARDLAQRGHAVTVIDIDPAAFDRLGPGFKGETVVGVGFDRDVLLRAGIERADGLAAVTASDEANIVTARVARQIYRVPRVVARAYDPAQAEVYRRLGLQIISPIALGVSRLAELLVYSHLDPVTGIGNGDVDIVDAEAPPAMAGRPALDFGVAGEVQVVAISRDGRTLIPTASTRVEAGDLLHLAVARSSYERVKGMLGA